MDRARRARSGPMVAPAMKTMTMITAVVRAPDGVRFVVTGHSLDEVMSELLGYVRDRFRDVLWPRDARQVAELITMRDSHGAVAAYFGYVGSRWDEELLEVRYAPTAVAPIVASRRSEPHRGDRDLLDARDANERIA